MSDSIETRIVRSIEGTPTSGPFFVKTIVEGTQMSMLEVRLERGVRSEPHSHSHESIIYVVSGKLASVVDGRRLVLSEGESCRHPENVTHMVEAIQDSVFVEVKSPAPQLDETLGA